MKSDAIVVGGGLVGAATALALARAGLKTTLVERAVPEPLPRDASWDARIYAFTPGNADFLRRLGVWDALDQSRIAPIRKMAIWGDDGNAFLEFDAYEAGAESLGFIAESRLLQNGLWQALQAHSDVRIASPAVCEHLDLGAESVCLRLADGNQMEASLLVGADGGQSWVRAQAGISVTTYPYGQKGVVANFETEKSHDGIARQWFFGNGILAWLPLPGNRISIVWSAEDVEADALMALDEEGFCNQVAEAGHHALGQLRLITPPAAFPLRLQHDETTVRPRLALVGDAAHLVHPLAGQGVNLGLRDARQLVETLSARGPRDPGDGLLLRRYARSRRTDVLSMQAVTTGLQKLFNNPRSELAWLRNRGLALTNRISPIKRQLVAHALL